jgi:hypothetical protein
MEKQEIRELGLKSPARKKAGATARGKRGTFRL